ncbi:NUDIX hydrolase [Salinisphaera aquimarina]
MVAIREAATVALLRDGSDDGRTQLQVLLLRRHGGHVFAANAYVFPGGAVDPADSDTVLAGRIRAGLDYANACLGDTGHAVAYWTAAIRECFEEAGLLLACDCSHVDESRRLSAREALNAGTRGWAEVVDDMALHFRLDELAYFAHWVTPAGAPKRYSTRFFAALAPDAQSALSDGFETIRAWWATPAEALAANDRGEIHLMTPTRATLERLCDYEDAESALAGLVEEGVVQGA